MRTLTTFLGNLVAAIVPVLLVAFVAGTAIEFIAVKLHQPVPDIVLIQFSTFVWNLIGVPVP